MVSWPLLWHKYLWKCFFVHCRSIGGGYSKWIVERIEPLLYSPSCISSRRQCQLFNFFNYINVFLSLNVSLSISLSLYRLRFDLVCHTVSVSHTHTHTHTPHLAYLRYYIITIAQKYLLVWSKMVHVIHTVVYSHFNWTSQTFFILFSFLHFSFDRCLTFPNSMLSVCFLLCSMFVCFLDIFTLMFIINLFIYSIPKMY